MNREETAKAVEVMQAYVDGAEIESRDRIIKADGWGQKSEPAWAWTHREYRIKPKPREFWVNPLVIVTEHCISAEGTAQNKGPVNWIKVREVIE